MQTERWSKIEKIFNDTLNLPANDREQFIITECGGDFDLCREIIHLVDESQKPDDFLSKPLFSLGAQLLDREFENLLNISEFGHYRLKELLGRGGIGAVFVAEDRVLRRKVALKILPAILEPSDERVLRFKQEARLASRISHPNIAHIYQFDSFRGYHSLAMEYIRGKTLRAYIRERKPDLSETLRIVIQITKALIAAHTAGIIHRDIKPENVMVTDRNEVKVLDFGLAKSSNPVFNDKYSDKLFQGDFITAPGLLIGTAAYMSPEQIDGLPLDEKTDIWSFGVLFYEMAIGTHPFLKESNIETLHHILKEPPKIGETSNETVPASVLYIIEKCLEKDPGKRFQTATELLNVLIDIRTKESFFDRRKTGKRISPRFTNAFKRFFGKDTGNHIY